MPLELLVGLVVDLGESVEALGGIIEALGGFLVQLFEQNLKFSFLDFCTQN